MISCIFYMRFALCMQKMYNHSFADKSFLNFARKMFETARIRLKFTDFDTEIVKCRLWKSLWKV